MKQLLGWQERLRSRIIGGEAGEVEEVEALEGEGGGGEVEAVDGERVEALEGEREDTGEDWEFLLCESRGEEVQALEGERGVQATTERKRRHKVGELCRQRHQRRHKGGELCRQRRREKMREVEAECAAWGFVRPLRETQWRSRMRQMMEMVGDPADW